MTIKDTFDLFVATLPFLIAVLGYVIPKVSEIEAVKRNENLKSLANWAMQGVVKAHNLGLDNAEKKQAAIDLVVDRLQKNALYKKFSNDQISAEIEKALINFKNTINPKREEVTEQITNETVDSQSLYASNSTSESTSASTRTSDEHSTILSTHDYFSNVASTSNSASTSVSSAQA